MPKARTISRNGARYLQVRGLDLESNKKLVERIAPGFYNKLVGMDTEGMRFRVY